MPALIETTATGRELSQLFGVSVRTVTDLANRGIVVRAGTGRYELGPSVLRYCAHLRDLATGRGGEGAVNTAAEQRARQAKASADLAETKNARLRGELVPAADVQTAWTGIARGIRSAMLAVPSRIAGRLPALTPHDVREIDAEIREALTELANSDD